MTDLDDFELFTETPANPAAPAPRKCRRHRWSDEFVCLTCGRVAQRVNFRAPSTRFWEQVDITGDCWEWRGLRISTGYGRFAWGGTVLAHRASWELTRRERIPAGMVVMHICDNPPCVRPSHLRIGTMAENQADMVAKGRAATGDRNGARRYPERLRGRVGPRVFGERNGQARLTEATVHEIRESGLEVRDVAARFGISKSQASRILSRKRWAHV